MYVVLYSIYLCMATAAFRTIYVFGKLHSNQKSHFHVLGTG